ncbi:MAG: phage tail tape measure protein [Candidatus Dadabacteria bacterium]|nr:phage tail tape measure protein [Candidatus Dadabacteria bacterium]
MPITNIATLAVDIVVTARRARAQLANFRRDVERSSRGTRRLSTSIGTLGLAASAFLLLRKAIDQVATTIQASIKEFVELEENIRKIEMIAQTGNIEQLAEQFFSLSENIKGATFEQVSDSMITAARAGVRGAENIQALAEAGLILSKTSLDIAPNEAVQGLAAISLNMGLAAKDANKLSNAINVLSDENLVLSGEITKTTARLAGFADTIGLTAESAAAISTSLLATQQSATTVRGALTALGKEMSARPFEVGMALGFMGEELDNFVFLIKRDATKAIDVFINKLAAMSAGERFRALEALDLASRRTAVVLLAFAENIERVEQNLETADEAINNTVRNQRKLFEANQTQKARLEELNKEWKKFLATLGTVAIPVLNTVEGAVASLTDALGKLTFGDISAPETIEEIDTQISHLQSRLLAIQASGFLPGIGFQGDAAGNLAARFTRRGMTDAIRDRIQQLQDVRKSLEEAQKPRPKLSPEEETRLDKEAKAKAQAEKEIRQAIGRAEVDPIIESLIRNFETDPVKRELMGLQDNLIRVRTTLLEYQHSQAEADKIMRGLTEASMKAAEAIREEARLKSLAARQKEFERVIELMDEEAKVRADFGSRLAGFAGEFGDVATRMKDVMDLATTFEEAGQGGIAELIKKIGFGDLLSGETAEVQKPQLVGLREFGRKLLLGSDPEKTKEDRFRKERLALAKKAVELMTAEEKDRDTMIEHLETIAAKEGGTL